MTRITRRIPAYSSECYASPSRNGKRRSAYTLYCILLYGERRLPRSRSHAPPTERCSPHSCGINSLHRFLLCDSATQNLELEKEKEDKKSNDRVTRQRQVFLGLCVPSQPREFCRKHVFKRIPITPYRANLVIRLKKPTTHFLGTMLIDSARC